MSKIKKLNMVMIIVHMLIIIFDTYFKIWGGVGISFVWVIVHTILVADLE